MARKDKTASGLKLSPRGFFAFGYPVGTRLAGGLGGRVAPCPVVAANGTAVTIAAYVDCLTTRTSGSS